MSPTEKIVAAGVTLLVTREPRPGGGETIKVGGPDAKHASAVARAEASSYRDPGVRCSVMVQRVQEIQARLPHGLTPEDQDLVARMWRAFTNQTENVGPDVRALRGILEATSRARASGGEAVAQATFLRLLAERFPSALAEITPPTLALADECAGVWRMRAGRPGKQNARRPKWDLFAALHEAIGLGAIDADDAKRECVPSRVKNGRKVRR